MRAAAVVLLCAGTMFAQHWKKQESHTDASLRGVKAVSDKICWASGTGGTVLRTTDGGKQWQVIHVPGAEKLDFRDIEAPNNDAKTAVVMSAGPAEQGQAKIFKTTDGGAHWKETFSTDRKGAFLDSIAFWDGKHGIGLSDPVDGKFVLISTEDGGDSWRFLTPKQMPAALPGEGGFAASGTTIVVAGRDQAWFGTGGASVSRLFHSDDGGQTWRAAETPIPAKAGAGIFTLWVSRHGQRLGIAGGNYQSPQTLGPHFLQSSDGGQTWDKPEQKPYISGITFSGSDRALVGSTGDWSTTERDPISLNAVDAAGDVFWAVGPKGVVARRQAKR